MFDIGMVVVLVGVGMLLVLLYLLIGMMLYGDCVEVVGLICVFVLM